MTEPQWYSAVGSAVLALVTVLERRRLFSTSTISGLFIAYLVFGFVGILLLPWARAGVVLEEDLRVGFGFIDWRKITDRDLSLSILIYVGGFLLALLGHRIAGSLARFQDAVYASPRELRVGRLVAVAVPAVLLTVGHVALNPDVFAQGIETAIIGAEKAAVHEYRYAAVTNYPFVLTVYNVLPFLSTTLWAHSRSSHSPVLKVFSVFLASITAVMLLLTFQKMPLMVFAIALGATELAAQRARNADQTAVSTARQAPRFVVVSLALLFLISLLQSAMKGGEAQTDPLRVSLREIFGRISVGAPMFVHYFPDLGDHYGLSGLRMFALVTGEPLFETTAVVFRYFTHSNEGSAAIAAIVDFYCAWGWPGWVIGCTLLGVALAQLDRLIRALPRGESRLLAIIYAFTFCMHLGQASVFNASFGYGGVFFLSLWFVLFAPKANSAATDGARPMRNVPQGAR
ncbi:MAG: hypothetical protein L6Q84_08635 [Polyangiaceae bacterium]|nr:hypothetical protein [Polyangiaceae bacterium]